MLLSSFFFLFCTNFVLFVTQIWMSFYLSHLLMEKLFSKVDRTFSPLNYSFSLYFLPNFRNRFIPLYTSFSPPVFIASLRKISSPSSTMSHRFASINFVYIFIFVNIIIVIVLEHVKEVSILIWY